MPTSPLSVVLRLLGIAIGIIATLLSVGLLCVCTTLEGTIFALAGILLGIAPVLAAFAWELRNRRLAFMAFGSFLGWVSLTAWLCIQAPDGHASEDARVQNRYVGNHWAFRRYPLGNLLPEVDQFMLGFKLVPAVDPFFTLKQSRVVSDLTASIYRELDADPEFHALGSAMPQAYAELWQQPFDHGHYYLYRPKTKVRGQPLPVIVFLHGSGGNFKAYTWILREVADELGVIIIAPTFGMGNWHLPDSARVGTAALADAAKLLPIDLQNVHLMGLSNGGLGVSQAASLHGSKFRSLVFLSPVFDRPAVGSTDFTDSWRGRPVLVVTGTQDERVPFDYVQDTVGMMSGAGVQAILKPVNAADHFMLFSHRQEVVQYLKDWLKLQIKATPASS